MKTVIKCICQGLHIGKTNKTFKALETPVNEVHLLKGIKENKQNSLLDRSRTCIEDSIQDAVGFKPG